MVDVKPVCPFKTQHYGNLQGCEKKIGNSNYCDSLSSLNEIQKGAASQRGKTLGKIIGNILFSPFRILGWFLVTVATFVKDLFSCCLPTDKFSINWEETKDKFAPLYNAVKTPEYGQSDTEGQKKFTKSLNELSRPAFERFCYHIGIVLAQRRGIKDPVEQIKWYQENRSKINFHKDYFENISGNQVLSQAVANFDQEIEKYTE